MKVYNMANFKPEIGQNNLKQITNWLQEKFLVVKLQKIFFTYASYKLWCKAVKHLKISNEGSVSPDDFGINFYWPEI